MTKWDLFQELKAGWLRTHTSNQLKYDEIDLNRKKIIRLLQQSKKKFVLIKYPFMIKTQQNLNLEGNFNLIKGMHKKPTANIPINDEI